MKKIYIYLMAGLVLAGCSKATDTLTPQRIQEPESQQQTPDAPDTFTLKVETVATKALTDNGQTLGSEWKQGDSVSVYNLTAEEKIEGWLKATTDGPTTVFEGTVSGNFNQGDTLVLEFLSPDYYMQDGTLEGLASQSDYAVSKVEVSGINPEEKTIATTVAEFEKMQAVVKFNITNRKSPVEPLKVTSFTGSGKFPGSGRLLKIIVTPAAATDELYVAIPYFGNTEITFEAKGEDGYDYRLIVPEVSFTDGLYYRRTLNMKRKALVKAPVAKTNLTYNTSEQALVDAAHVYWKVNDQEVILDNDKDFQQDSCVISYFVKKEVTADMVPDAPLADEEGWSTSIPKQTHAGTYYVWTKMKGNYDYEDADVSDTPVKVVIAKATPTINATAVTSDMTYNGQSQDLLSAAAALKIGETVVTTEKDAAATACTIKYYVTTDTLQVAPAATDPGWKTSYSATHAGAHFVWIMTEGNGDMNAATAKVSKVIAKATPTLTAPTAKTGLTFNGNKNNINGSFQTLINAGSTTGGTLVYKVGNGSYNTFAPAATDAGTYTVYYKVIGNDNYNGINEASFTVTIAKADGFLELDSYNLNFNSTGSKTVNVTAASGTVSVMEGGQNANMYLATYSNATSKITVTAIGSPTLHEPTLPANVTVTSAATTNYNAKTATINLQ